MASSTNAPKHPFDDHEDDWPEPSPEAVARAAAAPESNAQVYFWIFMMLVSMCVIGLPTMIARGHMGSPVQIEAHGYFMSYVAPLGTKKLRASYFIGTGSDGKCHVGNQPASWDTGLCSVRLRQIEANDCNVLPAYRDEHCEAMHLGSASPEVIRRPAHVMFRLEQSGDTMAWELP